MLPPFKLRSLCGTGNLLGTVDPANDVIVVTAPIGSSITVLNINGQVIKKQLTEGSETTLNVSDLSADVYLVQVQTAEGIATQKVIKK
jgi:hypothetical protein